MKKILIIVALAALTTACGSTKIDELDMQKMIAFKLGLASSDEVTISNIKETEVSGGVNSKKVTLDANTARNKKYKCSFTSIPSLTPFEKPDISNLECKKK